LPADVVMAPDPVLDAAPWDTAPLLQVHRRLPTADDMVGVTSAMAAVAETGTLVAESGPHHPSTLNFVPETHIVVLPAGKVVGCYEDVWDSLREAAAGAPLPRTINFISGPSRTGDIEQTITLGAHGPRRLHVILVDGHGR
jgi:L-lactate dehydrogenase complex protein LldG